MPKVEERIATLESRLKELKAKQAQVNARRRATELRRERRDEVRRKILVGAIVLGRVERGEIKESELRHWLDEALSRDDDRALFELPARTDGVVSAP
jgi:hypothetical protein